MSSESGFGDERIIEGNGSLTGYLTPEKYLFHKDSFSSIRLTTKQGKDFPLDKREIPTPLETLPVVNNEQEPFRHMLNGAKIVFPRHTASDGYYDHNNGYYFGKAMLHLSGKEKDALKSLGPFTYSAIAYFSFIKYES
ncbi:MAG: hypothetical protein GY757_08575, partial [bacterium]|nr:hypothetical protein [bacterium]